MFGNFEWCCDLWYDRGDSLYIWRENPTRGLWPCWLVRTAGSGYPKVMSVRISMAYTACHSHCGILSGEVPENIQTKRVAPTSMPRNLRNRWKENLGSLPSASFQAQDRKIVWLRQDTEQIYTGLIVSLFIPNYIVIS